MDDSERAPVDAAAAAGAVPEAVCRGDNAGAEGLAAEGAPAIVEHRRAERAKSASTSLSDPTSIHMSKRMRPSVLPAWLRCSSRSCCRTT